MMHDLRILIYTKGDLFVAQCLEHDICVQSHEVDEIRELMARQIHFEMDREGGLSAVRAAPKRFFDDWDAAESQPNEVMINNSNCASVKVSVEKPVAA